MTGEPEGNTGIQIVDEAHAAVQADPEKAGDIAAAAMQAAPNRVGDIAAAVVQAVPDKAADAAAAVVNDDPNKAGDIAAAIAQAAPNKAAHVAATAIQSIPTGTTEEKKNLALQAAQGLSPQEQKDLCNKLTPTQGMTDQIWLIVVSAFALVFVLFTLALFWSAFLAQDGTQILLTVVTTVAGLLAGFISGRSSTGGSPG